MLSSTVTVATVTVEDNIAPTALCQDITVQLDENGQGSITSFSQEQANSVNDWSSTQGQGGWSYGLYDPFQYQSFSNLTWNGFVWHNPGVGQVLDFPQLDQNGGHPAFDGKWAVRRWTSDYSGPVTVSGDFYDRDTGGGNGAHVRIFKNGVQVYEYLNIPGSSTNYSFNLDVSIGDLIDFAIDPIFTDAGNDDTHFTSTISTQSVNNGSFDNCGIATIVVSDSTFTCAAVSYTHLTLPTNREV